MKRNKNLKPDCDPQRQNSRFTIHATAGMLQLLHQIALTLLRKPTKSSEYISIS
jgi:hypothetical protein